MKSLEKHAKSLGMIHPIMSTLDPTHEEELSLEDLYLAYGGLREQCFHAENFQLSKISTALVFDDTQKGMNTTQ